MATTECPLLVEIDTGVAVKDLSFAADGWYLVGGTTKGFRTWRVADGKQIASIPAEGGVYCVTTSRDGRYVAWGTEYDGVSVFDTKASRFLFVAGSRDAIEDIDFSPNSTRLVTSVVDKATIWDIEGQKARRKVRTLTHSGRIYAAKYSPEGDRIATGTSSSIRIWDSNDGRLLLDIKVGLKRCQHSLLWCKNRLFVQTKSGKIKQINAATGSIVSEWTVPSTSGNSQIALPQHAKFIAYSAKKTITLWDTATHVQRLVMQHTDNIYSFAFSSDDSLLAFAPVESKIIVRELFQPVSEPELGIDDVVLGAWKNGQLADAEALLSAAIGTLENTHHALASRALVRARLGQWEAALADAEKSIESQRSLVGYIAKCVSLVGKGEKDSACRVCDIASLHFPSDHVLLLLVKAVALSMAGEHACAISRMDSLITDTTDLIADPALYVVRAQMHVLLGDKLMKNNDYEPAIRSFERAQIKPGNRIRFPPLIVSLISGWIFGGLGMIIQQRLCEALFVAGRVKAAGESIMSMLALGLDISESDRMWISDFECRCRSKLEVLGDSALSTGQYDEAISHYTAALSLSPASPRDLLMKRSNAWAGKGAQEDALNDAKEWVLMSSSWMDALTVTDGFMLEKFAIYQAVCDHLEMTGRVTDAVACFHQMSGETGRETDDDQVNWTHDFKSRCCRKLVDFGDSATNRGEYDEAVSQYTVALSLDPVTRQDLLVKRSNALVGNGARDDALNDAQEWARTMLTSGSWSDAIATAVGSVLARFAIYRAVCEYLETTNHLIDAVTCFHQMSSEPGEEVVGEQESWARDFESRCRGKLEVLGDDAVNAKQYDEAIAQYSAGLSLGTTGSQDLLVKRSKVHAENGKWEDALHDANEVIKLDPSSLLGYERKYPALLGMGHLEDATGIFETMISKMSESADPNIRERSHRYVPPERILNAIRTSITNIVRDSPLVLINTLSGHLCNKSEQTVAFESTPGFAKLITSMTTHIDYSFVDKVVGEFYRYATLSHTWEGNKPLYEKVIKIMLYDLEASPTHEKLRMFCKIAREEGFNWAWSDTCCIDQADHSVLQEALVNMFKWYEGSAMTIIFLCDVDRLAELGALTRSLWNSRGWALLEYLASKVVRIYTKDWTPYLGLTIYNHKESPEIISEMEQATGSSAGALMTLRPGLNDIREKLRLASTRQTTRVEDAAYSLLGIFSLSLPVTYGEGDKALGRLLSQILTSSGDTSILAWTGTLGSFNSCLPTNITVFGRPATTHIPLGTANAKTEAIAARLQASSLDLTLAVKLYDQLNELSPPSFVGQWMKLPCLAFKINLVSRRGTEDVFRAQASLLGAVNIETNEDLSQMDSLYLVHPWINFLLNRQASRSTAEARILEENESPVSGRSSPYPDISGTPDHLATASLSSSNVSPPDKQTHVRKFLTRPKRLFGALRAKPGRQDADGRATPESLNRVYEFLARLERPFGALLLASTRQNVSEYRRVATESLITVQVQEITSTTLKGLIQDVQVLDVF